MGEELLFLQDVFLKYTGVGFTILLFFACFLYLPLKAEKEIKSVLFYPILLLLLLVAFNPLMVWFWGLIGMDQSVYWRTYWLFLMIEVIAYVAVCLLGKVQAKTKKYLAAGAMAVVIALCGTFIITPQNYTLAENPYKLFDETIEVADILKEQGYDGTRVCLPIDLVAEIRQYEASISLTFSRDVIYGGIVNIGDEQYQESASYLYGMLYKESIPFSEEVLYNMLETTNTNYLVQRKDAATIPFLNESEQLQLLAQTQEHNIYSYMP